MSLFQDKVLLITGGTGSFGNAVLNRFLRTDIGEIRIFSRDEKKQDDMRHDFQARMPEVAHKIKFYIGDVRNKSTLKYAMKGVDYRCMIGFGVYVGVRWMVERGRREAGRN